MRSILRPPSLRRGAAATEFAIVVPLLVLLFVGAVDFARVFYYYVVITNCARNGATYGSIDPTHATDTTGIQTMALTDAVNLSTPPTVTSTTGNDSSGNPYVQVTVTWTFYTITSYPGIPSPITLSRTVQMRVAPTVPNNAS